MHGNVVRNNTCTLSDAEGVLRTPDFFNQIVVKLFGLGAGRPVDEQGGQGIILLAGALQTLIVVALRDVFLPMAVLAGGLAFLAAAFGLRVLRMNDVVTLRRTVLHSFARHPVS